MGREVRHFLFDMLEHIAICERMVRGRSVEDLRSDQISRMVLERAIEIISEASRHIPDEEKLAEPGPPWRKIADIGNRLRHSHHTGSVELIHSVATEGVTELKPAVERLYEKHKRPADPWPDIRLPQDP
jgi:uncharacterized protein with HEPN domain